MISSLEGMFLLGEKKSSTKSVENPNRFCFSMSPTINQRKKAFTVFRGGKECLDFILGKSLGVLTIAFLVGEILLELFSLETGRVAE
jgi:hypothetical protein